MHHGTEHYCNPNKNTRKRIVMSTVSPEMSEKPVAVVLFKLKNCISIWKQHGAMKNKEKHYFCY